MKFGRIVFGLALAWALPSLARGTCIPTVKWRWDGGALVPVSHPFGTPLVGQLTDDNGDGRIDAQDDPDVLFFHSDFTDDMLTLLDGATGAEHWTLTNVVGFQAFGECALGDIDGDGRIDIIAADRTAPRLVALEADGRRKWTSDTIIEGLSGMVGIADLDQDGSMEIYEGAVVFNSNGKLRFKGTAGQGNWIPSRNGYWPMSSAADVVPGNAGMEVLAGRTAYSATGAIVWNQPSLPDGWTAVASFDGGSKPQIVLTTGSEVYLLDSLGNPLGPPYVPLQPTRAHINYPTIADVDGDGSPEVVIAVEDHIEALRWNGSSFEQVWTQVTQDKSGVTGTTAFDLDGDGAAEIIYQDELGSYILNGRDGQVLWFDPGKSVTAFERPVVADLDKDGNAEILVVRNSGKNELVVYECATSSCPRSIFNQYTYHVTNVNDDGRIPRFETPPWQGENTWGAQSGAATVPPPDLGNTLLLVHTLSDVRMSWATGAGATTYRIYRGTTKAAWPPALPPALTAPTAVLPDMASPPALYYYRVTALNCSGLEGP